MNVRDLMNLDPRARKLLLIGELTGEELIGWRRDAVDAGRVLPAWEDDALNRRERELRDHSRKHGGVRA